MNELRKLRDELQNIHRHAENAQRGLSDLQNYLQNKQDSNGVIYTNNVQGEVHGLLNRISQIGYLLQQIERENRNRG